MIMREILFRAKTTVKEVGEFNNVWIDGDLITSNGKYYIHPKNNSVSVSGELGKTIVMHEVSPETVSQFTGLCDKNGRKIWENDIAVITVENGNFLVEWSDTEARWQMNNEEEVFIVDFNNYWSYQVEVIGNVFDNPELLEGI